MAIVDIVKYNGNLDAFAWKYPSEEVGTWTQLIVNESQEAILFLDGKAYDVFSSGRHTLSIENIPILNKSIQLPFGKCSSFTTEVWYVNKSYSLDIMWGTPTPIQIQDPNYCVCFPVTTNGMFGIRVKDSRKFLVRLVGTLKSFNRNDIVKYFRSIYMAKVEDMITSYVAHNKINVMEINTHIDPLSVSMKEKIESELKKYGIQLAGFYINDISVSTGKSF